MSDNSNTTNDALASMFFKPVADLRRSMFGDADLRAQWMDEYGIETESSTSSEVLPERQPVKSSPKSTRRQYIR